MLVGYARVSTSDQDLSSQLDRLRGAGCEKLFAEKVSGISAERPELIHALEFVREGDVLVVTRLDRFARSSADLHNLIRTLSKKEVGFRCIEQHGVDTTSSSGKLMLGLLGAVAEFELALRAERQREGIARAKLRGTYKGRRASIDPNDVRGLLAAGVRPVDVAKQLGIGRASVYRLMRP
jgi:DNA invertase Pin-like site-specific DNA recombinase